MRDEIRLYSVESGTGYESFALADCVGSTMRSSHEFRRLCHLLNRGFLIEPTDAQPAGERVF